MCPAMNATATNKEILDKEYAAYRKVYRAVFWLYYVLLGLLCILLFSQVAAMMHTKSAGGMRPWLAIGTLVAIWYLFYLCDTEGGLLKLLRQWEKSLLHRLRQEEAMEALRTGGIYFIDDTEMTLVDDKYLVPKDRLK
jgi:hypothetical protein